MKANAFLKHCVSWFLFLWLFVLIPFHSLFSKGNNVQYFTITNLRCEYLKNPLGIETDSPRLSWNIESDTKNFIQGAYHIRAASSLEKLENDQPDMWDSGKVLTDQCVHIPYSGVKPDSRKRIYWQVKVYDQDDNSSEWSQPAFWEMGLSKEDWKASWMGTGEDPAPESQKTGPAPYFRKEFNVKDIASARVYICGLGFYEFYLNGNKVGDDVLVPNQTNFDKRNVRKLLYPFDNNMKTRVLYQTFDITDYLRDGDNAAGVILGNGWYNQRDRTIEGIMWYDTPRAIVQIEIELKDGSRKTIVSDASWKTGTGPILYNGIFTGELYDARLEMDGWNSPGFNDQNWEPAQVVRAPEGKLVSHLSPSDKVIRTIKPVSMQKLENGDYLFDMGEMISGWARLEIQGKPGAKITMKFIEEMGPDYGQKDVYICKGEPREQWEPRFTWHAFRHVQVSGAPYPMTLENIKGCVVNTDVESAGSFECSNELFNKIHDNYIRTQLGNFHGCISSDCPHRERLGYTGDGQILVESTIFNFDMTRFYSKWINDMADAQNISSGFVPHTAPFEGGGGGPGWGSSYVVVPWFYYQYYGDKRILQEHYQGMKRWIEYLDTRMDDRNIIVKEEPGAWCLGDWASPDPMQLPEPFVNTCYYFYINHIMEQVASLLDNETDQKIFAENKNRTQDVINKYFFNTEKSSYATGRQGADVFPLAFDIVPDSSKSAVLAHLADHIEQLKGHLDTGILALPLMMDVLTELGREDLVFTMLNQRDFPGYGEYIERGATTLWEYWDGKLSHSHPMYGSVIHWFFKYLAGIRPDPKSPGFQNFIIKPIIAGDVNFAKAEYLSLYGKIRSEWKVQNGDFTLNVEIPANTKAVVQIPFTDLDAVELDNNPVLEGSKQGVDFHTDGNTVSFEIGSGNYEFTSRNISKLIKPVRVSTPKIVSKDTLYFKPNPVQIEIISATRDAKIYYTLDGSEPDMNSKEFKSPFKIDKDCIIKAIAYCDGYKPGYIKKKNINFLDPDKNGLTYTTLEGEWEDCPDIKKLEEVKSGKVYELEVKTPKTRENHFAVVFETELNIKTKGEYTFYVEANDGGVLYIDNNLIVDEAGYSGQSQKQGRVVLKSGLHPVQIIYFENTGTESLDIYIEGPEMEKQKLSPALLFLPEK